MKHLRCSILEVINKYINHYQIINGGIDGYYEKTILEGDVYQVVDIEPIACFSVYEDRGLTSLVVYEKHQERYNEIFDYVIKLPLFNKVLFTENDIRFIESVNRHKLAYEVQAYNFIVDKIINSKLPMKQANNDMYSKIKRHFGEFIDYNNVDLKKTKSFYYESDNELVSFGALEPLNLNEKRYCISMIVSEKHRNRGYGKETVRFLISYLQSNGLEVNARCYVLNEISKRTLIKSGMIISNRLFKIENIR